MSKCIILLTHQLKLRQPARTRGATRVVHLLRTNLTCLFYLPIFLDSRKRFVLFLLNVSLQTADNGLKTLKDYSLQYKNAGNAEFKSKNYEKAIDLYTKAISLNKDAVYYNNRAACYNALEQYEKAIEDASTALELDNLYLKALSRRAQAYEKLGNYQESVLDYTAAALLSGTPNDPIGKSIDRMLMRCGEERAKGLLESKPKTLPSVSFVNAYIDSFHKREVPESIVGAEEGTGNFYLKQALEAMDKKTTEGLYEALSLVEKAIENKTEELAWAYEIRGSFKFWMVENEGALNDLTESIAIAPSISALIKRALLFIEVGEPVRSNEDFDAAINLNPEDPDIYYHRGQVHFLLGEFDDAAKDYQKAIVMDKEFMSSHIQLAVMQYKLGDVSTAMTSFKRCTKNFPEAPEVFNYYGEVLMDNQKFSEAIEMFDKAFELEKKKKGDAGVNVLPLINKAFILWSFKQGTVQEAERLLKSALECMLEFFLSCLLIWVANNILIYSGLAERSCCRIFSTAVDDAKQNGRGAEVL